MYVCVCMYVYKYVCVYVCMCVCMYVYACVCLYVCIFVMCPCLIPSSMQSFTTSLACCTLPRGKAELVFVQQVVAIDVVHNSVDEYFLQNFASHIYQTYWSVF